MPFGQTVQKVSPVLNTGRLRHKIDIVQPSSVQDSTGGFDLTSNVVYANCWASIEAILARDAVGAGEFTAIVTHQIVIRYIGAAPSWLALYNYVAKALVVDSKGNMQQAQSGGGTSGATAPAWDIMIGNSTSDGDPCTGVVWKNLGKAPLSSGVNAGMQVWFQERTFQIEGVMNPDERNKMLILLCVEINDSQQQKKGQQPGGLN